MTLRYRRIQTRLWCDPRFAGLAEGEKLLACYLISGPQTTNLGLCRLSPAAAAEDLRITAPTFRRRFATVCHALGWRFDADTRTLWIPSWPSENAPSNPNVVRAWRAAFDEIPDSPLKAEAGAAIHAFLQAKGEPFSKAFGERFSKPFAEPVWNHSPNTPDPDPEKEMVRRAERAEQRRAGSTQTRDAVRQLRVLAEHDETRERSGA
jgi:hypothetical protein